MSNTQHVRANRADRRSGNVQAVPSVPDMPDTWDEFMAEAVGDLRPFVLPLPTGEKLTIECPDGDAMDAFRAAGLAGDDMAACVAIFGEENAGPVMDATAKVPFMVRAKLVERVLAHYGLQSENLPE